MSTGSSPDWDSALAEAHAHHAAGRTRESVMKTGALLETLLRELFATAGAALGFEGLAALKEQVRAKHRTADKPVQLWTLGELATAFGDPGGALNQELARRWPDHAALPMALLARIADIRNRATHEPLAPPPTDGESLLLLVQVDFFLRVHRRLSPLAAAAEDLDSAAPLFRRAGLACAAGADSLRVEWLGLTLNRAAGHVRTSLLHPLLAQRPQLREVLFDVLVLDPEWEGLAALDPRWPEMARRGLGDMADLAAVDPRIRVVVHAYRAVPQVHGLRFAGRAVVASLFRKAPGVAPSAAPYFFVSGAASPLERLLGEHFAFSWETVPRHRKLYDSNSP
jgi:hypothetical protein